MASDLEETSDKTVYSILQCVDFHFGQILVCLQDFHDHFDKVESKGNGAADLQASVQHRIDDLKLYLSQEKMRFRDELV